MMDNHTDVIENPITYHPMVVRVQTENLHYCVQKVSSDCYYGHLKEEGKGLGCDSLYVSLLQGGKGLMSPHPQMAAASGQEEAKRKRGPCPCTQTSALSPAATREQVGRFAKQRPLVICLLDS